MLPSKGYFCGIPCVFFTDDGCSRPHCHYRHSYLDLRPANIGRETESSRHLKPEPSKRSRAESDQSFGQNSWSPEQVSLVTKLVKNAVDKAIRSDATKVPRDSLVKNTLDKLFEDPEAQKMASKRKPLSQAESVPAYKPTPISKLTTKHIPVLCAPETPCSSANKTKARKLSEKVRSVTDTPFRTQSSMNSDSKHSPQNRHTANNVPNPSPDCTLPTSETPTREEISKPEQRNTYRNQRTHKTYYGAELTDEQSSQFEGSNLEFDKHNRNRMRIEGNSTQQVTGKGKTKTSKKCKAASKNSDENMNPKTKNKHETAEPLIPGTRTTIDKKATCISQKEVVSPKRDRKTPKDQPCDCSEPPAKKKKSETISLQVSSTTDPFSRWMQNKKIREILGKNKTKDSHKQTKSSEPKSLKRSSHHETPQNTAVKDELPEPKIPKRTAHKQEEFRPVPIVADDVKIPSALRYHFCAAFFEEFKKNMPLDVAKRRALDEELQAAKNSKTAKTYKNNCSLKILKYRKGDVKDEEVKPADLTPAGCPPWTYGWTLYQAFSSYLLSESELKENGFPLAMPSKNNCAYVDKASRRYSALQPGKPDHKICVNCSGEFQVDSRGFPTTRDDCFYHWGKLRRAQHKGQTADKFTCCGGSLDSAPCEFSVYHVWSGGNEDCMEDFVESRKLPSYMEDHDAGIYALDCEMCYTTKGLELARLTVLDLNGESVFDEVVSMANPVLNYCTRFSGIDACKTAAATYTFDDVRAWVLEHFYDKTILVGHSLENDLKALKLIHRTIVDTSVTFPHKFGLPNKMSLKHLANVVLELNIQENTDGHDSKEDAATCLKLMMKKIQEDSKARKPRVIIGYNGKKK